MTGTGPALVLVRRAGTKSQRVVAHSGEPGPVDVVAPPARRQYPPRDAGSRPVDEHRGRRLGARRSHEHERGVSSVARRRGKGHRRRRGGRAGNSIDVSVDGSLAGLAIRGQRRRRDGDGTTRRADCDDPAGQHDADLRRLLRRVDVDGHRVGSVVDPARTVAGRGFRRLPVTGRRRDETVGLVRKVDPVEERYGRRGQHPGDEQRPQRCQHPPTRSAESRGQRPNDAPARAAGLPVAGAVTAGRPKDSSDLGLSSWTSGCAISHSDTIV